MKNLQSYGVQELNAKEIRETDGGVIPLLALLVVDVFMFGFFTGAYVALSED